jgi:hypothetical protein
MHTTLSTPSQARLRQLFLGCDINYELVSAVLENTTIDMGIDLRNYLLEIMR